MNAGIAESYGIVTVVINKIRVITVKDEEGEKGNMTT